MLWNSCSKLCSCFLVESTVKQQLRDGDKNESFEAHKHKHTLGLFHYSLNVSFTPNPAAPIEQVWNRSNASSPTWFLFDHVSDWFFLVITWWDGFWRFGSSAVVADPCGPSEKDSSQSLWWPCLGEGWWWALAEMPEAFVLFLLDVLLMFNSRSKCHPCLSPTFSPSSSFIWSRHTTNARVTSTNW